MYELCFGSSAYLIKEHAADVMFAVIMGLGPAIYALLVLPRNSYNPLVFHLPFWW
jgi:hypothetical protein